MAASERPVAPLAKVPAVEAPRESRSTPADARRSQASRVRTEVRTQLARSQRRRHELSHALGALRRDLREFRSQVRMRLREMSHEALARRTAPPKQVTLGAACAPPCIEPVAAVATTLPIVTARIATPCVVTAPITAPLAATSRVPPAVLPPLAAREPR